MFSGHFNFHLCVKGCKCLSDFLELRLGPSLRFYLLPSTNLHLCPVQTRQAGVNSQIHGKWSHWYDVKDTNMRWRDSHILGCSVLSHDLQFYSQSG